jgi:hypothetical protein
MDRRQESGRLASEIALLQHGFADESIPGLYDIWQTAFAEHTSAGNPDFAAIV